MGNYPDWFLQPPYRPAPAAKGETDRDVLHLGVGRVAHSWEHLEGSLYYLYTDLLMRAHPQGANLMAYQATFGAVISSSVRRAIIEAMVRVSFPPNSTAIDTIIPVLSLIQRGAGLRNNAVHGLVVRYTNNNKLLGLFVMPPNYVPLPAWPTDGTSFDYRFDRACLDAINLVIETLRTDILKVADDLKSGAIGSSPKTPLEPKNPKALRSVPVNGLKGRRPQRSASLPKLSKAQARAAKIAAAKEAAARKKREK